MSDVFLIDHVRTPRAKRKGKFSGVHAVDLLTYPLNALKERNQIDPSLIDDVVVGCVTQTAEQGWCVARRATLAAGWPITVPATTVNRLCASGLQAVNNVTAGISAGFYNLAVAGGVEHMTRVPMFSDCTGEESPLLVKHHPDLVQQGVSAEIMAEEFGFSRSDLDSYAVRSQSRATQARSEGRFSRSIVGVPYLSDNGEQLVADFDDNIRPETTLEGLATLKTVFKEGGVVTAGNASAIVDGAAAVLLASEAQCKSLRATPRARIVTFAQVGSPPRIMLTGPVEASKKALHKAGLRSSEIDIWEINEAFAPVPIYTMRELGLDPDRVNVNGGGISLGHPLGATGAMILGMAVDELERIKGRYAVVTLCIGLGMGVATVIERI